ncbi:MAG: hypothetical protein WA988_19170, partial [Candidatus Nanopelagicales bacterium]
MIRRLIAGLFVASTAAVAGCGQGPRQVDTGQGASESKNEFAQEVGGCTGPLREGGDPFQLLASPGVWLQLDGLSVLAGAGPNDPGRVEGTPKMVGGDPAAERTWLDSADSPFPVNADYSESLSKALDLGAELY